LTTKDTPSEIHTVRQKKASNSKMFSFGAKAIKRPNS
jgi:hypothetical protein